MYTESCRAIGYDEDGEMSSGSREGISHPSEIRLRGLLGERWITVD